MRQAGRAVAGLEQRRAFAGFRQPGGDLARLLEGPGLDGGEIGVGVVTGRSLSAALGVIGGPGRRRDPAPARRTARRGGRRAPGIGPPRRFALCGRAFNERTE